ncbi:MAG: hypothetical protein B6I28_01670 [Fusobacteriia bacterium 4572_132]|nr:MAG: hypothetical protein B6I28_01670 [Fusobacteriia bacterium 4572_132]
MNQREFIDKKEKSTIQFYKRQREKNQYLGEYKERVIALLYKEQLLEDDVYKEILEEMGKTRCYLLKLAREVGLEKLKPYIKEAEKIGLKYQLVDGLNYVGNVGLVLVAKEALEEKKENLAIRDMDQDFIDMGLGEIFSKARGKKICRKCYKKVEEKLPKYKEKFKKLNILDKLLGKQCAICGKDKERK